MNINATLVLQSIAMMIFVWFCMKFIWPPLLAAIEERQEKIAEGLAAAEQGAERVADFMGDPGGELTDGGQFFTLDQL